MSKIIPIGKRAGQALLRLEFAILLVLYTIFIVSDRVPLEGWMLLVLLWIARLVMPGEMPQSTPVDMLILILLLWLPLSLRVSTNWALSLPKVYGLILGVAFYYAVVNHVKSRQDLAFGAFWLAIVGLGIAVAGMVGTDWAQGKITALGGIYDRLPRILQGIPRSIAGGFARNGVGGTLTLVIPLLTSLLLNRSAFRDELGSHLNGWYQRIVIIALVLSLTTLALTQSRGALLGTTIGLAALAVLRERRWLWAMVPVLVGLAVLLVLGYGPALAESVLRLDGQSGTLASRLEVWQRGLWMLQDFPFTGVGIGTYNQIAHSLYPFFIAAPEEVVAHSHNTLVQVGVDLGVPGLIAFAALLTGFVIAAVRAYRSTAHAGIQALVSGLGLGMLAHQVFGLTDAFILGTKPGVLLWVYIALVFGALNVSKQSA